MAASPGHSAITRRLLRAVFTGYLLVAAVVAGLLIAEDYRDSLKTLERELALYERIFAKPLALALWDLHLDEIQATLNGIAELPLVSGVKLTHSDGRRLLGASGWINHLNNRNRRFSTQGRELPPAGNLPLGSLLEHRFPIVHHHDLGQEQLGYLSLYVSQYMVIDRIRDNILLILAGALINTLALLMILNHYGRRLLARPLGTLTEAVRRVDPERPERLAGVDLGRRDDELGTLAQAFNQMVWVLGEHLGARQEAEQRLEQAAILFRHIPSGAFIADQQGRPLMVNDAFTLISGYVLDTLPQGDLASLCATPHGQALWQQALKQAALVMERPWQEELLYRHRGDQIYPVLLTVVGVAGEQGRLSHIIGLFEDLSERKQLDRLQQVAHNDHLTGLANRGCFLEQLDLALQQARLQDRERVLLYMDLNGFKPINDQYGHAVGDQVLQEVARRLRDSLREQDLVARLGGDEFTVLLDGSPDEATVNGLAAKLQAAVAAPIVLEGRTLQVHTSLGSARHPQDGLGSEALLAQADAAMYRDKRGLQKAGSAAVGASR